jgi:hypothetical protein
MVPMVSVLNFCNFKLCSSVNYAPGDAYCHTKSAPHISSLYAWLLAHYRKAYSDSPAGDLAKQYLECLDFTGNATSLLFAALRFHDNVLHHFLYQSSDLTNLLEHFDMSDVINVKQWNDLKSWGLKFLTTYILQAHFVNVGGACRINSTPYVPQFHHI